MKKIGSMALVAFFLCGVIAAQAQIPRAPTTGKSSAKKNAAKAAQESKAAKARAEDNLHKKFLGSFFFSPLEIAAIEQALKGDVIKKSVTRATSAPIPKHRVIRLSGVYYRSPQDWVVWMNGQKVTPKNLLPQIVSIHVSPSSRVSLKWYDIGLNKVLALSMHPHQTYDITTGILLPEAH